MSNFEPVIGLEIHLELKTKSKFFCDCPNQEAEKPNINVCPICLGHPGVLPTINQEAVVKALKLGLALNGKINENCHFDRKNYFYPDLPKGYQISQYQAPLIVGGEVETENGVVYFERIHLEEDTAKIFHFESSVLLDFNRAGVPLLEIVTKPEIKTPGQAKIFLEELQRIVRRLDVSDAEMEKGQMRCDANISLRPPEEKGYYPKTEIKNLNSFKAVEESLSHEIKRQERLWDQGRPPKIQSTRGWNEKEGITVEQRTKEGEQDYRYFPEPDLPPLNRGYFKRQGIDLDVLKAGLPKLPFYERERYKKEYGLDPNQAKILTRDAITGAYGQSVISLLEKEFPVSGDDSEAESRDNKRKIGKLLVKWFINGLMVLQKSSSEKEFRIPPEIFFDFLNAIFEQKILNAAAQEILKAMFENRETVDEVISKFKFKAAETAKGLEAIIEEVIENNPEIVEKYKEGKEVVIQYLIGQAMKKARGRTEPKLIQEMLKRKLKNL